MDDNLRIPDYKNESISEAETLEMLLFLKSKFEKNKFAFMETAAEIEEHDSALHHDWEKLISEFRDYLKFTVNIKLKKGTLALSFFNTKYGFHVGGSWLSRIKGKHWQSIPLSWAVAEGNVPNEVVEFVVRNIHMFRD